MIGEPEPDRRDTDRNADALRIDQPGEAGAVLMSAGQHQGRAHRRSRERRSEEHTSELQSLMRISYAVFCLKKKTIRLLTIYRRNDNDTLTTTTPNIRAV